MSTLLNPASISLNKKKGFLKSLSEDDFRDLVVRPLFLAMGLTHGKDICGVDEDGKDYYMFGNDVIRGRLLHAIQTKKGDLKMSAAAKDNVLNVVTQLRTALNTDVKHAATREILRPDCVILAASGEINKRAQEHIVDELKDTRIVFRDSDWLIPNIDSYLPELWWGIDVKKIPYLKAVKNYLIGQSDTLNATIFNTGQSICPITDDAFTQLYLYRWGTRPVRHHKKTTSELAIDEFPIEKILERKELVCIITGEAGSGKTTALRRIAIILIDKGLGSVEGNKIPFYFLASELTKDSDRLVDLLAYISLRLTNNPSTPFSIEDLNNGNVVVLIDGLDEIASQTDRETVLSKVNEFRLSYPLCRVVIASRDYSFIPSIVTAHNIIRFHISPISFKQAGRMVEKLSAGQSLDKNASTEILRRLENVHGMELNPLLVTIFVATSDYSKTDIPANITEVFKKFTEMMLGRWDISKGLAQQYQAPLKEFLLCKLANTLHHNRRTSISRESCLALFEKELSDRGHEADIAKLTDEIINRSGLIRTDGETVSFRHHLLQEYFAGKSFDSAEEIRQYINDDWWMRPIVFFFGSYPDDSVGISTIRDYSESLTSFDKFKASIAIGLSMQACYLIKTSDKITTMRWLVETLSTLKPSSDKNEENGIIPGNDGPILRHLRYYLYGRDAVSAKVISSLVDECIESEDTSDIQEYKMFWIIVGLIETNQIDKVEEMIRKFKPKEVKLLLALHMCCYAVQNLHVTSDKDKKIAKRICDGLLPRVSFLMPAVLKELKGILLEIQEGEIRVLPEASHDHARE